MKKVVSALAAASLFAFVPAPAQAADPIKVTIDKVCAKVRENGEVVNRYVLTRYVVTHYDAAGQMIGQPETTKWKRWDRRHYPKKWARLCGPNSRP